ncbi:hypothetical protein [Spongiimicrobium salis]|uniref:hypothetical protein n=1 Tax=Spongiimicrobium salis TaxID=1667022 RepID=UPI00374D661C
MTQEQLRIAINALFNALENEVKTYETSPEDWNICQGNVAVCLITDDGDSYGRFFGHDKLLQRASYATAYKKASQVWITGYHTNDYEKMVFDGQVDPEEFSPIELPDLIGWLGGQRLQMSDTITVSVGFSGFRGFNDVKIVKDAWERIKDSF